MNCSDPELATAVWQALQPERWPVSAAALPADAVLVGGAVRDALLGRLPAQPDLDLIVDDGAIALARDLAKRHRGTCVVLDSERDIARLVIQGWTLDLARRDGPDLRSDLGRRDYTVNAIALPLSGPLGGEAALVDPTGGLAHLRQRRLVAVREANLLADPLRLLRGIRLAAELEFALAPQTQQWLRQHAALLQTVAGERVLAELEKLVAAPAGEHGLELLQNIGLLPTAPAGQVHAAELRQNAGLERGFTEEELAAALPGARLAWLLDGADVAALNGSRRLQQRCRGLRHWWRRLEGSSLGQLEEGERLELHEQLGEDLPALLLGRPVAEAQGALLRWRDGDDPLFHPQPPVDGRMLQNALGLKPGPHLGLLLHHLKRERAFGRLEPGVEPALACAQRWLSGYHGVVNC